MNTEQKNVIELLNKIGNEAGELRLKSVGDYLGFTVGGNPVDPQSEWKVILHEDFDSSEQAVLALKNDVDLTEETMVREVRKRHEQVIQLKESLGASYIVPLAAFVGEKRIVIYRVGAGNRDERLDLTIDSVTKVPLYAEHFNRRLRKDQLRLKEDEFGFGYDIIGLEDLFKRSLSGRFQQTIELYRKKLSEAIAGSEVRSKIKPLLTADAVETLERGKTAKLIEDPSFKSGLGCIVDTIILRQLLRRFLEGYYGVDSFNTSGIALGVGAGTLESALQEVVQVYRPDFDDRALQKALQQRGTISEQLTMEDLFLEEEQAVTAAVTFKKNGEEKIIDLYEKVRRQFEVAYGGDLFAGSVASASNEVENALTEAFPELMAKLWADTSTEQYSFRYEDLPPELLQQQYEASMSRAVQIQLLDGKPTVFYGNDKQEQKAKGAYYTDNRLVDYMVRQSVQPILNDRLETIREALKKQNPEEIRGAVEKLLDMKIVDMTCGGGSFLRGAFYYLTEQHQVISRLPLSEELIEQFPMMKSGDAGQHEWEKHLLSNVLYGVDIDYKALIICSQTLTLSALRHWEVGEEFPELIGRTLIHQNALISPVPFNERKEQYQAYQGEICQLIELRTLSAQGDKKARIAAEELRQHIQLTFKKEAHELLGDSADMLFVESFEINVPEVFFHEDGSWNENGGFDAAIGNPPWEIWKPNAEEFFERYDPTYRKANKQEKIKMEQHLFTQYPILQTKWESTKKLFETGSKHFLDARFYSYQKWKVNGKFTGSDINLYKVSIERFYQVVKEEGFLSILVPGNIATDQGATGLRHLLLRNIELSELLSFENRKKIFEAVDSRFKIALVAAKKIKPSEDHDFKAFFYRHDLGEMWSDKTKLQYPIVLAKQAAPDTWGLLELRDQLEVDILSKLYNSGHELLGEENNTKLTFRRELDMTNDSSLFTVYNQNENFPLYEGKTIFQYENRGPIRYSVSSDFLRVKWLEREKRNVNEQAMKLTGLSLSEVLEKLWNSIDEYEKFLKGPEDFYRIGYREVARGTDKRTLISTILPKKVTFGNTLVSIIPMKLNIKDNIPFYEYSISLKKQLLLVGIFNSFSIDFILRRKVGAHVSIFYMYQLPMPRLEEDDQFFYEIMIRSAHLICISSEYDELAKEAGMSGFEEGITDPEKRQLLQNQIDAYVAKLYGLSRQELIYILSTFESSKHKAEMRRIGQGVIEAFDELTEKGEIAWPE
ncbi:hypothetical protein KQ939_05965 [Planococcus sp. CP5-4]|uniref:Eco57I restriction-modification methylase domain-containing protein n=1 Tax=unclassified Planococcus (in: firmicutes) TaxID=2662419 RepID=UPI001C247BDD|nr:MULTISPECIES: hypothetical protein [unclassified Planococcus (in: firmicutes)]MBU9672725.1 hypothetical protein [Planococcus sp. CP5-4_YE]MBV0908498.1 hypothetical protein [Planococcus sp. CP5-4_UN]MBW6063266.1 hypothetical protein [Planococcus sp. CP5-4]